MIYPLKSAILALFLLFSVIDKICIYMIYKESYLNQNVSRNPLLQWNGEMMYLAPVTRISEVG